MAVTHETHAEPRTSAFPMPHPPSASMRRAAGEAIQEVPTSRGFAALLLAYRTTGGTARGDDVARLLEDHGLGNFIGLARLIAAGEVFGFEWRGTLWIPMFQFDLHDLSVGRAAPVILHELGEGFDGWARAAWFAKPNAWLHGRRPVDALNSDLPEVLSAARADRFIAAG